MDLQLPLWFEIGSLIVLTLILAADLLLILKRPHIPSTRESTLWVVFYVTLALIFAGLMWIFAGPEYAGQFVAGSIYGGIIFNFAKGKVSRIFLGAAAE